MTADLLGLVNRFVLPGPEGAEARTEREMKIEARFQATVRSLESGES